MGYTSIAVAGATGNLGPSLVNSLVSAGLTVKVLSRTSNTPPGLPSTVPVVQVDYSSLASLTAALQGIDALISTIPPPTDQTTLIDAAIAAGVHRFIPSEFGSDIAGNARTAALPPFVAKRKTQAYLASKTDQISHTVIVTGAFLDWGISVGFLIGAKGAATRLFDGGETRASMTTLADVGRAIVGVLARPAETANRVVRVQSATVSQRQLLDLAQKGNKAYKSEVVRVDTAALERESYAVLAGHADGDRGAAVANFILISIWTSGYGSDWEDRSDNELLGIKPLSEAELEALVAKCAN